MICSGLGDKGESRNKGLVVQIKANDSKWKGIHGNKLIIQTINDKGVLIDTREVEIKRSKGLTFAVERVKTNANVVNQRKVEKAKEEIILNTSLL